jgi:hypothetical protein
MVSPLKTQKLLRMRAMVFSDARDGVYSYASEIKNRYSDGIRLQQRFHERLCVALPAYCGKIRV